MLRLTRSNLWPHLTSQNHKSKQNHDAEAASLITEEAVAFMEEDAPRRLQWGILLTGKCSPALLDGSLRTKKAPMESQGKDKSMMGKKGG